MSQYIIAIKNELDELNQELQHCYNINDREGIEAIKEIIDLKREELSDAYDLMYDED